MTIVIYLCAHNPFSNWILSVSNMWQTCDMIWSLESEMGWKQLSQDFNYEFINPLGNVSLVSTTCDRRLLSDYHFSAYIQI